MNNLTGLYLSQSRYDEAKPLYKRALEARERTSDREHPKTLLTRNNLTWMRLQHLNEPPQSYFERLLRSWTDPSDWKHHWARLGKALREAMLSNDFTCSEAVLGDLTDLLGSDQDRVIKGR